jgi:hypothetical protein
MDDSQEEATGRQERITATKGRKRPTGGFSSAETEAELDSELEMMETFPETYNKGQGRRAKSIVSIPRQGILGKEKKRIWPTNRVVDNSDDQVNGSRDGPEREIFVIDSSEEESSGREKHNRVFERRKLRKRPTAAFSYLEKESEYYSEPERESDSWDAESDLGCNQPHLDGESCRRGGLLVVRILEGPINTRTSRRKVLRHIHLPQTAHPGLQYGNPLPNLRRPRTRPFRGRLGAWKRDLNMSHNLSKTRIENWRRHAKNCRKRSREKSCGRLGLRSWKPDCGIVENCDRIVCSVQSQVEASATEARDG